MANFLEIVVGVASLGMGGWFLIDGIIQNNTAIDESRWPTVDGTIVQTKFYDSTTQEYVPGPLGGRGYSREVWAGVPFVRYTFKRDGVEYTGQRLTSAGELKFPDRKELDAYLALYPVGGTVPVHVDPRDPRNNVLQPVARSPGLTLAISAFLILFGVVAVASK